MRITPTHDKKSLLIAQKHGLKTNKFAVNKQGNFTKSAGDFYGKPASEFTKNIIKNLVDIHNLESTKQQEGEIIVHKKTGEKARPLLCTQLFIKIDNNLETIKKNIEEDKITITPNSYKQEIENTIETLENWPVTKEDSK